MAEVARHGVAPAQALDLETVTRPKSISDRALRVINLLHSGLSTADQLRQHLIIVQPRGERERPRRLFIQDEPNDLTDEIGFVPS